jgi:hypothetical protein
MIFIWFSVVAFVDESEDEMDKKQHESEGKIEFEGFMSDEGYGPSEGEKDYKE